MTLTELRRESQALEPSFCDDEKVTQLLSEEGQNEGQFWKLEKVKAGGNLVPGQFLIASCSISATSPATSHLPVMLAGAWCLNMLGSSQGGPGSTTRNPPQVPFA